MAPHKFVLDSIKITETNMQSTLNNYIRNCSEKQLSYTAGVNQSKLPKSRKSRLNHWTLQLSSNSSPFFTCLKLCLKLPKILDKLFPPVQLVPVTELLQELFSFFPDLHAITFNFDCSLRQTLVLMALVLGSQSSWRASSLFLFLLKLVNFLLRVLQKQGYSIKDGSSKIHTTFNHISLTLFDAEGVLNHG